MPSLNGVCYTLPNPIHSISCMFIKQFAQTGVRLNLPSTQVSPADQIDSDLYKMTGLTFS